MIRDQNNLLDAFGNEPGSRILNFNKNTFSSTNTGFHMSTWRQTGTPPQGAIPGLTPEVCYRAMPGSGGMDTWTNPVPPARNYIGKISANYPNQGGEFQVYDRLIHMGGLSGTSVVDQTVGIDLASHLGTRNILERINAADYSETSWWLEWYVDTGGTSVNINVTLLLDNGSTEVVVAATSGQQRNGRLFQLRTNTPGRNIRGVVSLILSASTGTAGNFGVTGMRFLANRGFIVANTPSIGNAYDIGLPRVYDEACLHNVLMASNASVAFHGHLRLAQK